MINRANTPIVVAAGRKMANRRFRFFLEQQLQTEKRLSIEFIHARLQIYLLLLFIRNAFRRSAFTESSHLHRTRDASQRVKLMF